MIGFDSHALPPFYLINSNSYKIKKLYQTDDKSNDPVLLFQGIVMDK